ncbi:MoaF-related domain-containing protein [Flavobacterium pectinovorum]|uniref:MoaF-related domain-containing protein n=1 Tax=Flavobacterium pectinovorum TaxID=29533 RepID=UPI001FAE44CB|nr:MoaF N-terminal domain-containing protein [Flavobacterium pectinovorum]MCI9844716.1 hypothetical protein [Flavobacterium pectinovorum]
MNLKLITLLAFITISTVSCNQKSDKAEVTESVKDINIETASLTGKKAKLIYPEFEAEVYYTSEKSLHWKTRDESGKTAEGDENVSYKKIGESQFFLNWIEKDGVTVSQVIDTKKGTVSVFLSYNDDKSSRGKRSADFIEGKWQEIK